MTELKYIVGATFRNFSVKPPLNRPGYDKYTKSDVLVVIFNNLECWVRFEEVAN